MATKRKPKFKRTPLGQILYDIAIRSITLPPVGGGSPYPCDCQSLPHHPQCNKLRSAYKAAPVEEDDSSHCAICGVRGPCKHLQAARVSAMGAQRNADAKAMERQLAATRVDVKALAEQIFARGDDLQLREVEAILTAFAQQERLAGQEDALVLVQDVINVNTGPTGGWLVSPKKLDVAVEAAIRSLTLPTAPQPLCADCGRPEHDAGMHLGAPGSNWGAALHHFWAVPKEGDSE